MVTTFKRWGMAELKLFGALCPFGHDSPTRAVPSPSRSPRRQEPHIGHGHSYSTRAVRQFPAQPKSLPLGTARRRQFLGTTRSTPIQAEDFPYEVIRMPRADGSIGKVGHRELGSKGPARRSLLAIIRSVCRNLRARRRGRAQSRRSSLRTTAPTAVRVPPTTRPWC
jgi:hypothetical protein